MTCATDILDAVPPAVWFIRRQLRCHSGGLSVPQFRVLLRVDQQPATSLSAVAEHLGASLPTTSRIVRGLVAKRLLTRDDANGDRRQLALSITPRGRRILDGAWSGTRAQMAAHIAGLSAQEQATICAAMGIFRTMFGAVGLPERIGDCRGRSAAPAAATARPTRRRRRGLPPATAATVQGA